MGASMRLCLIRHAIAEDPRPGLHDEQRALTPEGRERFEREVRGLERLGFAFERLVHSPLRRAHETAVLLEPLVEGECEASVLLAQPPGMELVASLAGEKLALVGHEPWLTQLTGLLIGGPVGLALKKGGVLVLEGEPQPGRMKLVQALAPATLRELGKR
jgi:phosphohistidine phosphatase